MYVYVVVHYWCLLILIDAYESVGTNSIHTQTDDESLAPATLAGTPGGKGVASAAARPSTPTALEFSVNP